MPKILLKQHEYTYSLQRQARKTMSLSLCAPDTLLLKAPHQISLDEILNFVKEKSDWIYRNNQRLKEPANEPASCDLKAGTLLPFAGRNYPLRIEKTFRRPMVELQAEQIYVNLYALCPEALPQMLLRWYMERAREILTQKTLFWCRKIGTSVNRIVVKEQKTRWGSCSSLGNVNYNWRIIMAPEEVVDYLVIHEVAHRIHLNHSAEFWALVARHCAEYRERKLWLKAHGGEFFQILYKR